MKTKGLSRGEILLGVDQGIYKAGDKFINSKNGEYIVKVIEGKDNLYLRFIEGFEGLLEFRSVKGEKWDLIQEPQFKVDDVLIHPMEGLITVYKVIGSMVYYHTDKKTDWFNILNEWVTKGDIRHATPEEIEEAKKRRFWASIGRSVNEYRLGDICKWKDLVLEVEYIDQDNVWLKVFNHDEPESCGVCLHKEELSLFIPVETPRFEMKKV